MVPHLHQVVLDFELAAAALQLVHSDIVLLVKEQVAQFGGMHACPSFSFHDEVWRHPDSSLPSAATIHSSLAVAVAAVHTGRHTDHTLAA
jgi:hypothetical protein